MTFEDFKEKIYQALKTKPVQWRDGQFVFNFIEEQYGDVARIVQFCDNIDCFYDDSAIDTFIVACWCRLPLGTSSVSSEKTTN